MTPPSSATDDLAARSVTAALAIAEAEGWDQVRLHRVAASLEVPLADVARLFRDVDAIADAWFARARLAMLAVPAEDLAGLAADHRLAMVLGRWLDALAGHRRIAGQILGTKLYPGHPQHWVPLVFSLSRLVHDLLDAARINGQGRRRQLQEIGMTGIVLATLVQWLRDDSPGQEATKERLARRLAGAGRLLSMFEDGR